ncbi:MAG: ATP-binding protein [Ardenticatenaceae bacterium]|nr:ATP-binding protein [Ardenticatenaceae bacterium]
MIIDIYGILPLTAPSCIGRFMAILGIPGSGKTNTAAVIMEGLLDAGIPILVIDIDGEYFTMKEKFPNVTVIGRSLNTETDVNVTMSNINLVAEKSYLAGAPVVFDMSHIEDSAREEMLSIYLNTIWRLSAVHRIPLVIFLEEAHEWVPQVGKTTISPLLIRIAKRGRKRGLGMVMISQRSADVHKSTLCMADSAFLHQVTHPVDMKVYEGLIPWQPSRVKKTVQDLKEGEALVLLDRKVTRHQIRRRSTRHVGFTPGLENIPPRSYPCWTYSNE